LCGGKSRRTSPDYQNVTFFHPVPPEGSDIAGASRSRSQEPLPVLPEPLLKRDFRVAFPDIDGTLSNIVPTAFFKTEFSETDQ
jgi:hypothetical protein